MTERATIVSRERSFARARLARRGVGGWKGVASRAHSLWHAPPYFGIRFWLNFWLISSKKIHPKGGVLAGGPPKNGHSWGPINFYMVIWSLPNFGIRFWLNFWLISSKKNHPKGGVLAGGLRKNCHSWGPINKAPKKCDPYAGIGTQEAKSNRFLNILVSQLR